MPATPQNYCEKRSYPWNPETALRSGDYAYARMRTKVSRDQGLERGYDVARHFACAIKERRRDEQPPLEQAFREHADRWWQETRILSSIQSKIFNPHYQRIIGMGRAALPYIFSELRDRGGQWYWALECISGDNPAAEAETLPEARRLWLDYADRYNYL